MSNNVKLPKDLKKEIENAVSRMRCLNSPALNKWLQELGFGSFVEYLSFKNPLFVPFLSIFILNKINPIDSDKSIQIITNIRNLNFFSELDLLIKKGLKKNKEISNNLISTFIYLDAIQQIKIGDINPIETALMNDAILELKEKYPTLKSNKIDIIFNELNLIIPEVEKRAERISKITTEVEKKSINLLNHIKNNYETTRYIVGLIIGFFDLLANEIEKDIGLYFDKGNSTKFLFFTGKYKEKIKRNAPKNPLIKYLKESEYCNQFNSIRIIFEEWVIKKYNPYRIFESHWQKDIIQDKLDQGIYKIYINNEEIREFKIDNLEKIYRDLLQFLLWTKGLVARNFFSDNQELFSYLI